MYPLNADVFFYGLFMDVAVLDSKGITATAVARGVVRDWALRIGNRATLVPQRGSSVYGMVMSIPLPDLERLYQDVSVQLYRPVAVLVEQGAVARPALAYVLSVPPPLEERNPDYAAKLRALAERIGLPVEYVASIT